MPHCASAPLREIPRDRRDPHKTAEHEAHIQIAVRDPACVIGTFRPRLAS